MSVKRYTEPLWSHDDKKFTDVGSKTIPTFVLDFPERGGLALKKTGEKPIYDMIQANLVNCDLQNVIESCVHSNQFAVCTQDNLNTMVADFTGVTNLGDLYVGAKRMENTWKELPLEVRESFGSDLKSFIRTMGTEDWNTKVTDGFNRFNDTIKKNTIVEVVPPDDNPLPNHTPVNKDVINKEVINNESE